MRFGVHYLTTFVPELDGSVSRLYANLFEQIQFAEQVGFDDAWVTEHHFFKGGGMISQPPVFLAALARATSRIHLGVAISVLPIHNPLENAEAYAMVDVLSDGRLEFGVGRGSTPEEYAGFRYPYEETPRRLHEHADILLQAWSDEPVSYHGEMYSYDGVQVLPKPVQRPHPPIWVGASRSDDTFRWAGEKGFHLLTLPYTYTPEVLQHWVGVYRDALRAHGHDPADREILGKLHIYVAESDATARDEAAQYWVNYQRAVFERGSWVQTQPSTLEDFTKQADLGHVIVGDPSHCADIIASYQESLGLTAFSGTFHFGGMPQELALRSLRLFAERVMPAFSRDNAVLARAQ